MREKGIIFCPTVAWLHARCLPGYVLAANPAFVEEAWRAYAAAKVSIVKARELGVKMAMGSDASHRFHHVPDGALESLIKRFACDASQVFRLRFFPDRTRC